VKDDRLSARYAKTLRETATIGDGKTLCCSVDVVAGMMTDCEDAGRVEGAMEAIEACGPLLGKAGIAAGRAFLLTLAERLAGLKAERQRGLG